jgi:damage-control phosphatase, subfamily II, stand-alone protein
MSHFCLLKDPTNYIADPRDFTTDVEGRDYWLGLFERHFTTTLEHALERYGRAFEHHVIAAQKDFTTTLAALREDPTAFGTPLNILSLCRLREKALIDHHLPGPFDHIKHRENDASIKLYSQVVRSLHALDDDTRWIHLVEAVFAGNIFDLGSSATMNLAQESPNFLATVESIKPRPWLIDDFDRLAEDLAVTLPAKWGKAIIFIDNAGCDFILGVMPLARELALEGVQVVLAANEKPSLNDLTADEVITVSAQLAELDPDLDALIEAGFFEVVSTGSDTPLIDFADVSDELNDAAKDADLIILEGMGRGIESNIDAEFTVDTLHLGLIKDPRVAAELNGEMYDCVCKYKPIDAE